MYLYYSNSEYSKTQSNVTVTVTVTVTNHLNTNQASLVHNFIS